MGNRRLRCDGFLVLIVGTIAASSLACATSQDTKAGLAAVDDEAPTQGRRVNF